MLSLIGIIAIVVFTIQVYKTAKNTERNAPLWALLTVGVGIVMQFVIPFLIGVVLVVYYMMSGTPPERLESEIFGLALILNVVCIGLSIVGMILVMKHVSRVRDDVPMSAIQPPPPPSF
jgi:thiamine transporter ThiT